MSKRLSNKFVNDSRIDVSSAKDSRLYSGRDSMRPTPREQDQNNIVEMQRQEAQKHLINVIQNATIGSQPGAGLDLLAINAEESYRQMDDRRLSLVINEALQEVEDSAFEDTFSSPNMKNSLAQQFLATGQTNEYGSSECQNIQIESSNMGTIEREHQTFDKHEVVNMNNMVSEEFEQPFQQTHRKPSILMNIQERQDVGFHTPGAAGLKSYQTGYTPVFEDDQVDPTSQASTGGDYLGLNSFKSGLYLDNHCNKLNSSTSGYQFHQAQQMQSAAKKKPGVLLSNIMKLEELIRQTSKEENPEPNYSHILRHESGIDLVRRWERDHKTMRRWEHRSKEKKKTEEQKKLLTETQQAEIDIISNTVEQMIAKIHEDRKEPDRVLVTQKFKKPLKYFESKGSQKAQMRTEKTSLIKRQRFSTTQKQITGLLDEFSSIKKVKQQECLLAKTNSKQSSYTKRDASGQYASSHEGFGSALRPQSAVSANLQKKRFSSRIVSSSGTRNLQATQPRVSQPANFFSNSPKNQDLPFKQFTRTARSKPLSTRKIESENFDLNEAHVGAANPMQCQLPQSLLTAQVNSLFSSTQRRQLTGKIYSTEQSPQNYRSNEPNINVNINFNVMGNMNMMTQQDSSRAHDSGRVHYNLQNPKSSLRRPMSGVNNQRQAQQRRENVDFDPKIMHLRQQPFQKLGNSPSHVGGGTINKKMRPMSAAAPRQTLNQINSSRHSSVVKNFNNTGQMPSALQLNPSTGLISNVTNQGLWQKGSDHTLEVIRASAMSRNAPDMSTFLTQVPSKNQLNQKRQTESRFSRKNSQAKQLKNYFQLNLASSSMDLRQSAEDQKTLRGQHKSLITQAKLFDQAYIKNKHINAQKTAIDIKIDEKEPTFPQDIVQILFNAKFQDLKLPDTDDQLNRFTEHCQKRNTNGKITFTDMKLGINFATALASIFSDNPSIRITHLNLERNQLSDEGAIVIVQAFRTSKVLISLNLSSNEIKPKGVNQILSAFKQNESLQELVVGSKEGSGCLNLVNDTVHGILEDFVVENKFCTILSMRGMGMTLRCIKGVLEKFREGYIRNEQLKDEEENKKNEELDELERKYFREDGENLALTLLMKTKRRYRPPVEIGQMCKKLTLMSLDLANNAITFANKHVSLFHQAIEFSEIQRLDLGGNPLGNEGIKVVACSLMFKTHLKYLDVSDCGFNLDGAYPLLGTLGKNKTVQTAIIDKNNLKGHRHRQRVLKDLFTLNKDLRSVSLNNCHFGEGGAQHISLGLGYSPNLTSLSIAGNDIEDIGADWLVDPMNMVNFQLTYLNMANNKITDKGGVKLAKGLMQNKTLQVIDLRHNSLSDRSVVLLQSYAKINHCLTKLHLEFNICNLKKIEMIDEMTKKNAEDLEKNKIYDVRREVRNLRKPKNVQFTRVNKDEELNEIHEKIEAVKGIIDEYQEQVDQRENRLLYIQENPDKTFEKQVQARDRMKEKLEHLTRQEAKVEAQIKEEKENLIVHQNVKNRSIEDSQVYRDHYAKILVKKEKELSEKKDKCDLQKVSFVEELDKLEKALKMTILKHDLAVRDIEKEQDRQNKEKRKAEEAEKRQASAMRKKKKEEAGKSKKGGKRKASASAGRKKAKGKKN